MSRCARSRPFPALSERLYRIAFVFVTACRCTIVSPIIRA